MDLRRGDVCNVSHLAMGVHSGTHMDGPVHFIHQGAGLDEMPLAATMGEARVIQIDDPREITADELRGAQRCRRVNGSCSGPRTRPGAGRPAVSSRTSCTSPSRPPSTWRRRGCRTVGVDYLSVGGYHADGAKIHRTLLEAGIWIIEGLDLSPVTAGPVRDDLPAGQAARL